MKKEETKINKLCERCLRKCKQSEGSLLVNCPKYMYKPQQLVFDFIEKGSKRKKK